jgi:type I restriction enzyme S subunit
MDVKPGYRITEVGVIPEDWEYLTLETLGAWKGGMTPSMRNASFWHGGDIAWISSGDVKTARLLDTEQHITQDAIRYSSAKLIPSNSIVVVTRSGILRKYLPVAILSRSMAINQDLKALIPSQEYDPEYLLHAFVGNSAHILADCLKAGTTVESVEFIWLKSFKIPIPPLPEQRAIAAALSDVDALIESLEKLIAKKRDVKQATMQQLLTGATRLPGFEGEWEVKRLGEVGYCIRGVSYRGDRDLFLHDTEYSTRLLRSNNVKGGSIVNTDIQFVNSIRVSPYQALRQNDILICMANGSKQLVGKAGLFLTDDGHTYTFGAFMGCMRVIETVACPYFVYLVFQTIMYRNHISNILAGSSINNLRPSSIEMFECPFPPMAEQVAIAAVLSDMDAEIEALEARRDKTKLLKQGVMQELLTGKTRLV